MELVRLRSPDPCFVNGYTGEGYIILNERGGGAYLINGGLYGGFLVAHQSYMLAFWALWGGKAIGETLTTFFSGTILAGLGLASNLLDLAALYDGTAKCLTYLVQTFVIEALLIILGLMFGPLGVFLLDIMATSLHWLATQPETASNYCKI